MKTKCHDLEILTSSTFWTCHPEKSRHSRNNPCRIKRIIAKTIYVKFDIDKKMKNLIVLVMLKSTRIDAVKIILYRNNTK